MKLKIKNEEWQDRWEVLTDIFEDDFKGKISKRDIEQLKKIGFRYIKNNGNHPKMHFMYNSKKYCITLSSSASCSNVGREILRNIRRVIDDNN